MGYFSIPQTFLPGQDHRGEQAALPQHAGHHGFQAEPHAVVAPRPPGMAGALLLRAPGRAPSPGASPGAGGITGPCTRGTRGGRRPHRLCRAVRYKMMNTRQPLA